MTGLLTIPRQGNILPIGCSACLSLLSQIFHPTPHLVYYMFPHGETVERRVWNITVPIMKLYKVIYLRERRYCRFGETGCRSHPAGHRLRLLPQPVDEGLSGAVSPVAMGRHIG
jgi:hypothetical protein